MISYKAGKGFPVWEMFLCLRNVSLFGKCFPVGKCFRLGNVSLFGKCFAVWEMFPCLGNTSLFGKGFLVCEMFPVGKGFSCLPIRDNITRGFQN